MNKEFYKSLADSLEIEFSKIQTDEIHVYYTDKHPAGKRWPLGIICMYYGNKKPKIDNSHWFFVPFQKNDKRNVISSAPFLSLRFCLGGIKKQKKLLKSINENSQSFINSCKDLSTTDNNWNDILFLQAKMGQLKKEKVLEVIGTDERLLYDDISAKVKLYGINNDILNCFIDFLQSVIDIQESGHFDKKNPIDWVEVILQSSDWNYFADNDQIGLIYNFVLNTIPMFKLFYLS